MNAFRRGARQALTIARRDFIATVFAPTFLLFLLTPIFMITLSTVAGMGASSATDSGAEKERIAIIAPPGATAQTIVAIDAQLRPLFRRDNSKPELMLVTPGGDVAAQARKLFDDRQHDVSAVLYGPLERPHIVRTPRGYGDAAYLAQIAEQTLRAGKAGTVAQLSEPEFSVMTREQATSTGRSQVAYFTAVGVFLLTLMLSGQAVGAMAEERSNKVIEVLAAAVPLESVFFGKLLGAFGSALLFIGFWGVLLANLPKLLPSGFLAAFADMGAAVGYPAFPLLFVAYFAMAYMLLSAVFLGVGALASTQREIQMLSLPITVFQVGVLGFATIGAARPGSWIATASEIFPFSSPHAMAARAANSPELWPHFLALGWQALWVAITVTVAARLFRRGVLKSGSPGMFRRKKAAA